MSHVSAALAKNSILELKRAAESNGDGLATKSSVALESPIVSPKISSRQPSEHRVVRPRFPASSPVLPFATGQRAAAEQYKLVRTKILHNHRKPQLLVISSAASGDGKTITAINLAAAFALKSDTRILLMDGDLRRSSIAKSLGLPPYPGLTDVLTGRADLEATLVGVAGVPNLFVLPAGTAGETAAELLDSAEWRSLIVQLRGRFSQIICDAPPVATVADYELLQVVGDGVVLVARPDHTERAACMHALESVERSKLLGVVLNCVQDWFLWKSRSYGYYGSDSLQDES